MQLLTLEREQVHRKTVFCLEDLFEVLLDQTEHLFAALLVHHWNGKWEQLRANHLDPIRKVSSLRFAQAG